MPAPTRTTPKTEPITRPDPTRRFSPKRVCPDQIKRTVEPLRRILP